MLYVVFAVAALAFFFLMMGITVVLLVFAVIVAVLVISARTCLPYNAGASPEPMLNQRAARLVGQTVRVEEPISATGGRVQVGDGAWSAKGCDAAAGTIVRITGTDGNILIVEKID